MSRDPFDEMRDRNPVPFEEQPPAPMGVAERIIGRRARAVRRPLPGFAVATLTALVIVVAGGALLMLTRPAADGGFADDGSTTLGTTPPPTTAPMVTTDEVVYFLVDQTGDGWSGGPFLIPVSVTVTSADHQDPTSRRLDLAGAVMARLLEGVGSAGDEVPGMSSAIPAGSALIGVDVIEAEEAGGPVRVDLSSEFVSGGGSFSMQARLAQVVYTLTAIDGIDAVAFSIDGVPTTVFGGEGVMIGDPATRDEFEAVLPAIMIESPAHLGTASNPLVASGSARVFEATVSIALTDGNGLIIWEGFTTATDSVDRRGDWTIEIPYQVDAAQWGHLIVWESSAEDGRPTNVREHRVRLTPADGTTPTTSVPHGDGCSGWGADTPFVEQGPLTEAAAATRRATWEAATECDWALLESLVPDEFSFSFGHPNDGRLAVSHWQALEAEGESPMRYLAELLSRPFSYGFHEGIDDFVWPSAFGYEAWDDVPEADREALRPLYEDGSFAEFEAFGSYIGYRIGIDSDGTWRFFITGD